MAETIFPKPLDQEVASINAHLVSKAKTCSFPNGVTSLRGGLYKSGNQCCLHFVIQTTVLFNNGSTFIEVPSDCIPIQDVEGLCVDENKNLVFCRMLSGSKYVIVTGSNMPTGIYRVDLTWLV